MQIQGTIALVTGANRGIGEAFAQALLERGAAKVYAGVRDIATVGAADPRLVPVQLDVTDADRVAAVAQELGDVELVVNNAGIARPGTPLSAALDAARAELEVNYLGLIATTQTFAPVLAANGGGAFINVLSVGSWIGSPILSTYSASKSAAWNFTNLPRVELKRQGTHVVGVHVGFVDTDLTAALDVDKIAPAAVAAAALDAVEAGEPEAVVVWLSPWTRCERLRLPWSRLFAAVNSPRGWVPGGSVYAAVTSSGIAWSGSWYLTRLSPWRSSSVNLTPLVSWVMRRSRTAQTSVRQLSSPGKRPITLVRRLTSPSDRSSRFVDRHRRRCLGG